MFGLLKYILFADDTNILCFGHNSQYLVNNFIIIIYLLCYFKGFRSNKEICQYELQVLEIEREFCRNIKICRI